MNITASHREFAHAHKVRVKKFWLQPLPAKPTAQDWYDRAWHMLEGKKSVYSILEIQDHVCKRFKVPHIYMESSRRSWDHYLPRAAAIYLCHKLTGKSLPVIGRAFGNRDHTTILNSIRSVEKMMALDHPISKDIKALTKKLGASHD